MSPSSCCLGGEPPSPDGIAPRPTVTPQIPPIVKLSGKPRPETVISTWSTGSRLSTTGEDAAAIQAIFEEEKSGTETERVKTVSKKTSSILDAVRSRLKKHLSQDSGITNSKRHSRASVGTSEEEVERRAELRRIRQKRIQEELSQEGVYDDDAKSISTVEGPVAPNMSAMQKRASWTSGDVYPLPALALPMLRPSELIPPESQPMKLDLPPVTIFNQKGPMLEALYYGRISPQTTGTKAQADGYFTEWSTTMVNSSDTRSRRHSFPAGSSPEIEKNEPIVYLPSRKRSTLPPMPSAPIIQPQRLPSVVEPSKSSWRLSFSADNRGDQLRKLSQTANINALLDPEKVNGDQQPMRRWLHSQGLRSLSQAVGSSEEGRSPISPLWHVRSCSSSQDFGGVDGIEDSATALHLYEMRISQRLASKGLQSSCSSPQLSSIGSRSHQRGVSSISGISRATRKSRPRHLQNSTDSLLLNERIPEAWGNILKDGNAIQDGTSSFYPSDNNSIQPSLKSSRFSLFSLMSGNKSKTDLTAPKGKKSFLSLDQVPDVYPPPSTTMSPISPQTPVSRGSIQKASASSSSLPLPFAGYHRRPNIDTNSTIVSETESFREREAELSAVRSRFAATEASRSPSTPRSSKFREEFDVTPPKEEPISKKPSAFLRLTRFATRSFDGPFEKKMGIPLTPMTPAFEREELQHHHHSKHAKGALSLVSSPLEDSSVTGMWEAPVKRNADRKAKDVASNLHIPGKKGSLDLRKKSAISAGSKDKKKFALKGLGWGLGDKDSSSESEREENPEDDWEAELAKVVQKAKGKSRNFVTKPTGPDRRYPTSWSKFPSHDRHERMSSADARDCVDVKDFATDGSEFLDTEKKALREKIQKKLIAHYDRHATEEVQNNTESTFGSRSSMRPAGDWEFPELEVLPLQNVSLMSHDEIAEHMEQVLQEEELDRKEDELEAIFGPVKKEATNPEVQPGINKQDTAKNVPKCSGTDKAERSGSKAMAAQSTATPVKKGPTARRVPVARKPGDVPPEPKPPPKVALPVAMPARGTRTRAIAVGLVDSSMDEGDEDFVTAQIDNSEWDESGISIADPRFYDDCIFNHIPGPETGLYSEESEALDEMNPKASDGSKKSKYKTWSGKDRDKYRHKAKSRRSLGTLKVRKSTDEVLCALKRAEVMERDNALRAAEQAWGGQ